MKTLIPWFGGKSKLARRIVSYFPPHSTYAEPFGGAASCLLSKIPSDFEVYNDKLSSVVDFFRIISKPDTFDLFYRQISSLPYSRQIFDEAWSSTSTDPITNAVNFYIKARQTFGGFTGTKHGWVYSLRRSKNNTSTYQYFNAVKKLPELVSRLQKVQFENLDFREIFKRYDSEDTLFYVDPPYPHSARTGSRYVHEMSYSDHLDLIKILLSIRGSALVSTYWTPEYSILGPHISWKTKCCSIHQSLEVDRNRVECLFFVRKPRSINPSRYLQYELLY